MIGLFLAMLTATPANIQTQINTARCGDTVQAVGVFTAKIGSKTRPTCPVTLDLTLATVQQLAFQGASNWTVIGDCHGGGDIGRGAPYSAIQVIGSDHLSFSRLTIEGYGVSNGAGLSLLDSQAIAVAHNVFRDAPGDGIDVVSSQGVSIVDNSFLWLTYGQVHADAVQIWNRPGDPLTVANVLVDRNRVMGHMQGFDTFGAGDPRPVSGIVITNNDGATDIQWQGAINTPGVPCLGCVMTANHAATLMGMPHGWAPTGFYDGGKLAAGNSSGAYP